MCDHIPDLLRVREDMGLADNRIVEGHAVVVEVERSSISDVSLIRPVEELPLCRQNLSHYIGTTVSQSTYWLLPVQRGCALAKVYKRLLYTVLPQREVANERAFSNDASAKICIK